MPPSKRDPYDVLGVDRDAGQDEIKKAYRKLALRFHPDRNPDDAKAEAMFREASESYQILGDPERRAQYDRFGHAAFDQGGAGGFDFSAGFEDLFGEIFGDFFGAGGRRGRSGARRGDDLRYDLEISFEEAVFGVEKDVEIPRWSGCEPCGGAGTRDGASPVTCPSCRGAGQMRFQQGFFSIAKACSECGGRGTVIQDPCKTCSGSGRVRAVQKLNVKIPPGIDHGSRLKLRGEGEVGTGGGPSGDLYVVTHVQEHPFFERDGTTLLCEIPVSFPQVALGTELEIPTIDGKAKLRIPSGTKSGAHFRLRGKGVPDLRGYGRGDQLVRVQVEVPRKLSSRQRELLEDFARESGEDVDSLSKGFLEKVKEMFG